MGKLAVVLFAVVAIQAVCGGVTRRYGYGQEEASDLLRQLATVSDEVIETLKTTPLRRGFSWENREFDQEIYEIIRRLEMLTSNQDKHTSSQLMSVLYELREIRAYFQQLWSCNDAPTMRQLEKSIAMAINRVAKHMESWASIFALESFNGAIFSDIKTILERFTFALRHLYDHINAFELHGLERTGLYSNKRDLYADNWANDWSSLNNEWSGDYLNKWSRDSSSNKWSRFGRAYGLGGDSQNLYGYEGPNKYWRNSMDAPSTSRTFRSGTLGSMAHGYGNPEYFGKHTYGSEYDFPMTYSLGSLRSMNQYETPKYFGKYSHGSGLATNDIWTLTKQIKGAVNSVAKDLNKITSNQLNVKGDLILYVRQLVQVLDNIIDRLQEEATTERDTMYIITSFRQIKAELRQMFTSGLFTQVGQIKYQLSSAIEQVATEIEKLTHLEKYGAVHALNDVCVPFIRYIRNLQFQIKNTVSGRDFAGYRTEMSLSGAPWSHMTGGLRVPASDKWARF